MQLPITIHFVLATYVGIYLLAFTRLTLQTASD